MTDVLARWGLGEVINAAGTMTSIGASRILPEVMEEMAAISRRFVRIEDLQRLASREIARATGAEAGVVTGSSAAALTLACAAAITGDDLAAIEALPATGGRARRIAVQMGHMVNYGAPVPQGIALSGAEVVPLGTAALCETYHLDAALASGLAAVVHIVSHHTVREGELPLDLVVERCARQGVPVIVDMASEYDLTGPVALGADAVIHSGHKFLGGPTTGIVAGRAAMIRAIALQSRGIGRTMKIGKEGILGVVAALAAWSVRDHAGARHREEAIVAGWTRALGDLPGLAVSRHDDWTGNPITRLELRLDPPRAGLFAWELAARLLEGPPHIAVRDDLAEQQRLYLDPCNLTDAEAETVAHAIRTTLDAARGASDGCRLSWSEIKRRRGAAPFPGQDL
jgi:L-seryl-tRNA(Ser) seleniumtransferase